MTSFDVPRNQVQQPDGGVTTADIQKKQISVRTTSQTTGAYTVPVGKAGALIKDFVYLVDAVGGGAQTGVGYLDASNGNAFVDVGIKTEGTAEIISVPGEFVIFTGDKIVSFSASGNPTVDFSFTVIEFD